MMTRNIPVVSVVFVAETQSHVGLIWNKGEKMEEM